MIITARWPASASPDRMPMPSSSRGMGKVVTPGASRKCPTMAFRVLLGKIKTYRGATWSSPAIIAWLRSSIALITRVCVTMSSFQRGPGQRLVLLGGGATDADSADHGAVAHDRHAAAHCHDREL